MFHVGRNICALLEVGLNVLVCVSWVAKMTLLLSELAVLGNLVVPTPQLRFQTVMSSFLAYSSCHRPSWCPKSLDCKTLRKRKPRITHPCAVSAKAAGEVDLHYLVAQTTLVPVCLTVKICCIYLHLLAFCMHKGGPNTTNPSQLQNLPEADFDLLLPPYHVCEAQGCHSAWTICYSAVELSDVLT